MGEKLVHCDVSDLTSLPEYRDRPVDLTGTPRQIAWADSLRDECRDRWKHDLPPEVFDALAHISDSTWWIANKDAETSDIKWPESWLGQRNRQATTRPVQTSQGRTLVEVFDQEEREKNGRLPATLENVENFIKFAAKAAQSPELAYLTILALAYRNTKDERILARWNESRERVHDHLKAISDIIGL